MTSARRPRVSPPRSVTGRLSSQDRRGLGWLAAGAPGQLAGVVVMEDLLAIGTEERLPAQPRVMPPAGRSAGADEQARGGVILSQEGHGGPAPRPARIAHTGCSGKKALAPPKRIDRMKS